MTEITLESVATFIDSVKNIIFAAIFVVAGFYVTVVPGINSEYARQWVDAAMLVAGVYLGSRIEKGKNGGIAQ